MSGINYGQSFLAIVKAQGGTEFSFLYPEGRIDEAELGILCVNPSPVKSMAIEFLSWEDGSYSGDRSYKLRFWGGYADKKAAIAPPSGTVSAKPAPKAKSLSEDDEDGSQILSAENGDDLFYFEDFETKAAKAAPKSISKPLLGLGSTPKWLNFKNNLIVQSPEPAIFYLIPAIGSDGSVSTVHDQIAGPRFGRLDVSVDDERRGISHGGALIDAYEVVTAHHRPPGSVFEIRVIATYNEDGTMKFLNES